MLLRRGLIKLVLKGGNSIFLLAQSTISNLTDKFAKQALSALFGKVRQNPLNANQRLLSNGLTAFSLKGDGALCCSGSLKLCRQCGLPLANCV